MRSCRGPDDSRPRLNRSTVTNFRSLDPGKPTIIGISTAPRSWPMSSTLGRVVPETRARPFSQVCDRMSPGRWA
jgi:hypothetical protein